LKLSRIIHIPAMTNVMKTHTDLLLGMQLIVVQRGCMWLVEYMEHFTCSRRWLKLFVLEMNELECDLSLMMIPAVVRHYWERLAPL